jgi:hypothetical protein
MKAAYNKRTDGLKEMSAKIEFDQDCLSADELRLLETKEEILRKLRVIFGTRQESDAFSNAAPPHAARTTH